MPSLRSDYVHHDFVDTRWSDNDVYGHVNNVIYYSFFDTVINRFLIAEGALDIHHGAVIGLAVESMCRFFAPLAYPERVDAGLRIGKLGNSSVRYEIGLFSSGRDEAVAEGHFVHVFVDRDTRKSIAIPDRIRRAMSRLLIETGTK